MSSQRSKELHPCAHSFCQLLACFDTGGCPSILFWRACSPKRKWSSKGTLFDSQPEDALIPPWLLKLFKSDSRITIAPEVPAGLRDAVEFDFIEVSRVKGAQYLALGNAWQSMAISISTEDQKIKLLELLSVFVHGYPEPYAEMLYEEMTTQLSEATEASCMPVLSILNGDDINFFLKGVKSTLSTSYLVSLLQFVVRLLSIKRNSQSRSLQNLIPHIIGCIEQNAVEIPIDITSYTKLLQAIQELTSQLSLMKSISRSESFTSIIQKIMLLQSCDERSNATAGLALQAFSRCIQASLGRKEAAELCAKWRPISQDTPSPMEVFASANIITGDFIDLWLPVLRTGDLELRVLTGRAMAENNFYTEASMLLEGCLPDIEDRFGSESFEMSIALAELINYFNTLDDARKGERLGSHALERRRNEPLRERTDTLYLKVAVADSLIGLSRYLEGQQLLEEVMTSSYPPDSVVIKAALRLSKIQRRHSTDDDPLGIGSPLSKTLSLLSSASGSLQLEYCQELACAITIIRDKHSLRNGKEWTQTYNAFLNIFERMASIPSTSWAIEQILSPSMNDSLDMGDGSDVENSVPSSSSERGQGPELTELEITLSRDSLPTPQWTVRSLHMASEAGSFLTVRSLLLIIPVDARWNDSTALYKACESSRVAIAKLLLKKGADVNAQGGSCGYALQAASSRGHETIVRLLLQKGADVNAQGGSYGNALQAASYWGHKAIAQLLFENGVDINTLG